MALSGDHVHQILLNSQFRNRKIFPYPSDFEVTVRPESENNVVDPVANGYVVFSSTIASVTSGTPNSIELSTPVTTPSNLIGMYACVLTTNPYTRIGSAKIVGFSIAPYTRVYIDREIPGATAGNFFVIRQKSADSVLSFNPTGTNTSNTVEIPNGQRSKGFYNGMYLRRIDPISTTVHMITNYDVSGPVPVATFFPEFASYTSTDLLEIYRASDNESGLSQIGSIANRGSPVNHKIKLEWLRVPRHSIYVNNSGSDTSLPITVNNFPYLIVEFRNRSFGNAGAVQSNSRVARGCQFIVPIEDLSNDVGKFYTLRCPVTIVMQYHPNDTIRFSVKLPNGDPIYFDADDNNPDSLVEPYQDKQIVALFTAERILR